MLSWWSELASVATLNTWLMATTLAFAILTGIFFFLTISRQKQHFHRLLNDLKASRKQVRNLEKAAEAIRKELLETQQHQDISQLKLKTSKSSAAGLKQALLDARKRLQVAELAIKAHNDEEKKRAAASEEKDGECFETLELELEPDVGLSESQREQLIGLLDPGPKGNVDLFCVMGDEESQTTADQLEEILTADGWKTNGVSQTSFSTPPKGIVLAVNSKETAPSYASFLQRVFSTTGMDVSAKFDNKYREWSLTIIVGIIAD
ncbi:MAG: hypothetical protein CSA23_05960 [Deltaproteobacteria bacterium]|nr:MAG: hypothetical protein CSA23_05960 [Deltaproteobacteria bacterium]